LEIHLLNHTYLQQTQPFALQCLCTDLYLGIQIANGYLGNGYFLEYHGNDLEKYMQQPREESELIQKLAAQT